MQPTTTRKNKFMKGSTIGTTLLFVLVFAGGYFMGQSHGTVSGKPLDFVDSSDIPADVSEIQDDLDFASFWRVWRILEEKYPFDDKPEGQDRIWGAVEGLTQSYGDPYTTFFPPKQTTQFKEDVSGEFTGVGMEVTMRDDFITIVSPLKGTPADRAGVRPEDIIYKIGDELTEGMTLEEAVDLIRGEQGSVVTITVLREGEFEPLEIPITRDIIVIPTVDTRLVGDDIFVIELYNFHENVPTEFRQAIAKFADSGRNKLILDLRNNPGGFLDVAVDITSLFLPEGAVIVREKRGEGVDEESPYRSFGYDIFTDNLEMVVLVNGGSASASEIMAGALAEHDVATVIGDQTFGKGSVQEFIELPQGVSVKVTVAKWLTPEGISISENGLTPEYEISRSREDFINDKDPQLNTAVRFLRGYTPVILSEE